MAANDQLIGALASGKFVSGERIAEALGISRAAVWKQVRALRARGIPVDAVRGRGYRIHGGVPLIRLDRVVEGLHLPVRARLRRLDVEWQVDSTNARMLARDVPTPAASIAELQTAGRGRRGRSWHAPLGSSVCMSIAYGFDQLPQGFGGLGLAAGVAVTDALANLGYTSVALKWPNDLVIGDAKLGGLLVESRMELGGATRAVVGIGLNWRMPGGALEGLVEQRWTDLASVGVPLPRREALCAALLNSVLASLDEFAQHGFARFRDRWSARDSVAGRTVEVVLDPDRRRVGKALGVDPDGALLVRLESGEVARFTGGEVSVRGLE